MFQNVNILLRTVVVGGLVVIAGWWTLFLKEKLNDGKEELNRSRQEVATLALQVEDRDREIRGLGKTIEAKETELEAKNVEIETLEVTVEEKTQEIEALDIAIHLLKVDTRIAKLEVVSQGASEEDPDTIRTVIRFVEMDPRGEPIGEGREVVVEGKTVYVETLVVKFQDSYVEAGDSLRGTSICLFKRIFGENQRPADGQPLDPVGEQPLVYTGDNTPNPLHREIWERFWDYANDPDKASQLGVRAIHGEAPFIETRPGKSYWVELRASGGINIRPE